MKIGFKSDIHLDFWIGISNNEVKIERFVKKILAPKEMDVLIIAGDLGHYNYQSYLLLKVLKKWAKKILVVLGNHDFYLVSRSQISKYKTSLNRVLEFKEMIKSLEDVYLLNGNIIEISGIKFLGTMSWYDFSYALKKGYSLDYIREIWEGIMNDAKKIIPKIDPVDISFVEKEKLRVNIAKADIVFTHVAPFYISCYDDIILNSFYTFYGYDLFSENIKYWIFGHCHEPYDLYEGHIRFLSSPLGYPDVRRGEFEIKCLNINY